MCLRLAVHSLSLCFFSLSLSASASRIRQVSGRSREEKFAARKALSLTQAEFLQPLNYSHVRMCEAERERKGKKFQQAKTENNGKRLMRIPKDLPCTSTQSIL